MGAFDAGRDFKYSTWSRKAGADRADDRRRKANAEGRKAAFNSGFFAQTEAKLTGSDDVGQGKGRAREAAWGSNKGAGGWTPY